MALAVALNLRIHQGQRNSDYVIHRGTYYTPKPKVLGNLDAHLAWSRRVYLDWFIHRNVNW